MLAIPLDTYTGIIDNFRIVEYPGVSGVEEKIIKNHLKFSSGIRGLDRILNGFRPGDNVVFQVDCIEDYTPFVLPFCEKAILDRKSLVYFHFVHHPQMVPDSIGAQTFILNPENGFEIFISEIFDVIENVGVGGCYVFDCLSELAVDWYSDRMLGNFFLLTCPYLFKFKTVAYFSLLRNHHTPIATEAIHNTAQIVTDVYLHKDKLYLHPLKVEKRSSETMYMLHACNGNEYTPVTQSIVISEILSSISKPCIDFTEKKQDLWTRTFTEARQFLNDTPVNQTLIQKLIRMVITRDEKLLALCERYLSLEDIVEIEKRIIGSGLIGGKSVGMLLARAILKRTHPFWSDRLEVHDSFFIGSDVFYTYLIQNGCWWGRRQLKKPSTAADQPARKKLLTGEFPDEIRMQFVLLLNYFGQSPIIVRSSSLLEDAFGSAFSGKYESVFCANQGSPEERLEQFMDAVRTIYASTINKEALSYREHWQLLETDEQMALLVQRVSGEYNGPLFYPHLAGVGFSFNPFVWNKKIDPHAGFLRLVFGLGTRAVDRCDDDYTRIISLNAPKLRPEDDFQAVKKYAQRKVDCLDLKKKKQVSMYFETICQDAAIRGDLLPLFADRDESLVRESGVTSSSSKPYWVLTFDSLISKTTFIHEMKELLHSLEKAYETPVDVEFTCNFIHENDFRINVLQCRPFQVKRSHGESPKRIAAKKKRRILVTNGPVIGNSQYLTIDRCIYISPAFYGRLSMSQRYAVARLIGQITHLDQDTADKVVMIVGPGRFGTSTPALGIPVSFSEIKKVSIICEIALMHEGLVPDVSLGTHFFNDLVEMDMLYMAVHPENPGAVYDDRFFMNAPNQLTSLIPEKKVMTDVLKVIDSETLESPLRIHVDMLKRRGEIFQILN